MAKFGRMMGRKMRMAARSVKPRISRPPLIRVKLGGSGMHGGSVGSVIRSVVRGTASGVSKTARAAGMNRLGRLAKGVRLATFRGKRNKGYKLIGSAGAKINKKRSITSAL